MILPKLTPLLATYPQIRVELHSENRFVDIVAQGFDVGVRLGNDMANDMVAVKISTPFTTTLVATPNYLNGKTIPKTINNLDNHALIGTRLDLHRPPMLWDFWVNGQLVSYQPKTQVLMNSNPLQAVKNHLGIGFVGLSQVENELKTGELVEILADFRMTYEPFFAYYPSRKHHSRVFELVLSILRE